MPTTECSCSSPEAGRESSGKASQTQGLTTRGNNANPVTHDGSQPQPGSEQQALGPLNLPARPDRIICTESHKSHNQRSCHFTTALQKRIEPVSPGHMAAYACVSSSHLCDNVITPASVDTTDMHMHPHPNTLMAARPAPCGQKLWHSCGRGCALSRPWLLRT